LEKTIDAAAEGIISKNPKKDSSSKRRMKVLKGTHCS
jgi:hypothetical protein